MGKEGRRVERSFNNPAVARKDEAGLARDSKEL
jgi:hypothetical protein